MKMQGKTLAQGAKGVEGYTERMKDVLFVMGKGFCG
jgi:hypothetical protein